MTILKNDPPTSPIVAPYVVPSEVPGAINIRVHRPDDTWLCFLIRKTGPLEKLMRAYCEMTEVFGNNVLFLYGERAVNPIDTPSYLGMEEGAILEAIH